VVLYAISLTICK